MGMTTKQNTARLFILNELALRLSPALADEIGLNESIMLLQLEYWISISDHLIDGRCWTYQSVRQMQEKAFTFWSVATISRTAKSLLDKNLIVEGNYNKKSYDNTRWFALNYEVLSKLQSVMIRGCDDKRSETPLLQNETPLIQTETAPLQNETPLLQNETTLFQNVTTIPQITPQIIDDDEEDACAFESCLSSEIGQKAIQYAETNLERKLSKYEREKLISWCVKFREFPDCRDPEAIVIAVLERCVTKNDLSSMIAYINVVLEDFCKNSIVTLEQVGKEYQKLKNSQRDRSLGKPKPNPVILEKKENSRSSSKYEGFYL